MGNINFNDVKESVNHEKIDNANSIDDIVRDAMDDFLNRTNDSAPGGYLSSLSKQMNAMVQTTIGPIYLAKEFAAKCDVASAELYINLNSWIYNISEKAPAIANNFTPDALIEFSDGEPENITNILVDSYMKYNDILSEAPELTERLKSFPPAIKEVGDAINKLYNEFTDVKKHVYTVCAALDIGSDEFDKVLAKKIMDRTKKQDSAGDNNAQPTE